MTTTTPHGYVKRTFIDAATGEGREYLEEKAAGKRRPPDQRSRDPFIIFYGVEVLQKHAPSLVERLFWHFVDRMRFDDAEQLYFTKDLAAQFGASSPQLVTRALQRLEQEGKIIRTKRFRLVVNPEVAWRGTPAGRAQAIAQLTKQGYLS